MSHNHPIPSRCTYALTTTDNKEKYINGKIYENGEKFMKTESYVQYKSKNKCSNKG